VNPTTWRFYLRTGVTFHNGEPFNAEAVKFTLDRVMDKNRPYARRGRIGLVTKATVVDEHTVEIQTSAPFPLLPRGLRDIVIEPPRYVREKGDDLASRNPVGTGPFKVVSWTPNDRVVLEANREYWGGKPEYDRLVIRNIPEPSTRVAALKAGEIQVAEQIDIDLVREVEKTPGLRIEGVPVNMGLVLTFDSSRDRPTAVKNLKVRQAIDHAVDRQSLWTELLGGRGHPRRPAHHEGRGLPPRLKATLHDPAKAVGLPSGTRAG
jgi:peptide/nickel transport system substrate-binding protein